MNFVEELVAEWLQKNGWLVSKNVRYGPRREGGFEGECDLLAFHPKRGEYLHVECSQAGGARALAERFLEQFKKAKKWYPELMPGSNGKVDRLAVGGWGLEPAAIGESIQIKTIRQFVADLCRELEPPVPFGKIVPEKFPLLRAIQLAVAYGPGAS